MTERRFNVTGTGVAVALPKVRDPATTDSRRSLWIALAIWFVMLTSFSSFRSRAEMDLWGSEGIDLQVKFQAAAWLALGVLAAVFVLNGRADLRLLLRGPLFWFCAFTGLALLSAVYSDSHALTAFRAMQLAVGAVLVVSLREHMSRFYLFALVFIGINWVLFLVANLGLHGGQQWLTGELDYYLIGGEGFGDGAWRMQTAYGHPSIISIVAAMAIVGIAARTKKADWVVWGPVVAWLLLTMVLTISRTAIVGMLGGLCVVALGRRWLLPAVLIAGCCGPLVMFPAAVQEKVGKYLMRGQTTEQFQSLTGRAEIYEEAVRRAAETWHTGTGFTSNRKNLLSEQGEAGITHAHNLVLEALTGTGVLGVTTALLLLITWIASLWWIWRRRKTWPESDSSLGLELCGMLLPVLAFCILDRGFVSEINAFLVLFLVVLALTTRLMLEHESADARRTLPFGNSGARGALATASAGRPRMPESRPSTRLNYPFGRRGAPRPKTDQPPDSETPEGETP